VDLTGPPQQASSAKLYLSPQYVSRDTPTAIDVAQVTSDWNWQFMGTGRDRFRLWWANRPSIGTAVAAPVPYAGHYLAIDITTMYNAWKAGTATNNGMQIRGLQDDNRTVNFGSSNSGDFIALPILVVVPQ
jgi:hypothetical protein